MSDSRRNHIGKLLFEASSIFNRTAIKSIQESGFHDINKGDIDIISQIPTDSTINSVEIAKNLGISKQAVSKKVSSLVNKGYIRTARNLPNQDARLVNIEFSKKGHKLLNAGLQSTKAMEESIQTDLGLRDFSKTKKLLADIKSSLENFLDSEMH